jgi:hypothetical protein
LHILGRDREAFGLLGNPGIPRGTENFLDRGALGDLPDQSVFPASAADNQDFHFILQIFTPEHAENAEKN